MLLSICIPSYNRPESLKQLLQSIEVVTDEIEIVIAEDAAPRRFEVRNTVNDFKADTSLPLLYHENPENLGYDANLRNLINLAKGDYILFMGDDDLFKPGTLQLFLTFLKNHHQYNYILRSYEIEHSDRRIEIFKYFPTTTILKAGADSASFLFKRSVSIAGFTIRRDRARALATDQFDGTLLYQLYLVLNIAYFEDTIFCDIPVARVTQSFRNNNTDFGSASTEKKFTPGKISQENSIRFTEGFFEISQAFDKLQGTQLTDLIRKDLSKYAYPILSIQRKNGFFHFMSYVVRLSKRTAINQTWHFYFYSICLLLLGETICDKGIITIKKRIGYTPKF
ncbi:MAG: glycosyltransferase family 2 protein [Chitinophagia bacterium]|nr:glycosyltransferase family 2 protein [Chitinophagia bacterium]